MDAASVPQPRSDTRHGHRRARFSASIVSATMSGTGPALRLRQAPGRAGTESGSNRHCAYAFRVALLVARQPELAHIDFSSAASTRLMSACPEVAVSWVMMYSRSRPNAEDIHSPGFGFGRR